MCGVCGGPLEKSIKGWKPALGASGGRVFLKSTKTGHLISKPTCDIWGGAGLKSIKTGQPIGEPASGVRGAVFEKSFSEGEGGDGLSDKKRKTH